MNLQILWSHIPGSLDYIGEDTNRNLYRAEYVKTVKGYGYYHTFKNQKLYSMGGLPGR
jgi:hypothetical protein